MGSMALPDVEAETFSVRYRLTVADAHAIVWLAVVERLPVLAGLALLELVSTWSGFGTPGRATAIALPLFVVWRVQTLFSRTRKAANPAREIITTFSARGLSHQTATTRHEIYWPGIRWIKRHKAGWIFTPRVGNRFFVPARAIPTEARAPIARWAAAAQVRLD
jgi:hypothetical protein